jgi:hypothetical protein
MKENIVAEYTVKDLPVTSDFDLELFMSICQETRIGGSMMDALSDAWERWLPHAAARLIETESGNFLLVWLGEAVEEDVDDRWEEAPSEAFMYNALAQVMCMGIVHALIPEVEEVGCAPAPKPTDVLADALEAENVPYAVMGEPGLARRFAVMTPHPFRGGCEICVLRKECPKMGGDRGTSVTLPGFER